MKWIIAEYENDDTDNDEQIVIYFDTCAPEWVESSLKLLDNIQNYGDTYFRRLSRFSCTWSSICEHSIFIVTLKCHKLSPVSRPTVIRHVYDTLDAYTLEWRQRRRQRWITSFSDFVLFHIWPPMNPRPLRQTYIFRKWNSCFWGTCSQIFLSTIKLNFRRCFRVRNH